MTPIERPPVDVRGLMSEIDAAPRLVESSPIIAHRVRNLRPVFVTPSPTMEANWDVWLSPQVTTHRAHGLPIGWLKRASLLRLHDREILKRLRDFTHWLKDELNVLKRAVAEVSAEVQSRP